MDCVPIHNCYTNLIENVKLLIMELGNQDVLFTQQKHQADRAGLHYDYRIVIGDKAYSWASRHDVPEVGKAIVLHEQPTHDKAYALSKKVIIPKGQYGAGITELQYVKKGKVKSNGDHHVITTPDDRFFLKKMESYGPKQWLFVRLPKDPKTIEKKAILLQQYQHDETGRTTWKESGWNQSGWSKTEAKVYIKKKK